MPPHEMPSVVRLKYTFRNEIRVFTIKSDMTYRDLVQQLRASTVQMMDGDAPLGRLQLRYAEDDLVSILDERDWRECLSYYRDELVPKQLKLKLYLDYEEQKTGGYDENVAKTWSPCSLGLNTPPGHALITNQDRKPARLKHIQDDDNNRSSDPPPLITRPRRTAHPTHLGLDSGNSVSRQDSGNHLAAKGSSSNAGREVPTGDRLGGSVKSPGYHAPAVGGGFGGGNGGAHVETIKSWVKGNLIGRGANSEVFFGMCKHTAKFFAVKQTLVDKRDPSHSVKIKALQKEIELMSIHYHENIVRYLGSESRGAVFNIFLEYVPGGSISSLLQRFGSFHEKVVRLYTTQILKGLQFLHSNSVLHRDIKGGNILVSDKGQVKLADFGCSKKITVDSTGTKTLRGTALWMAPEVIRSSTYGDASDIWSVGCTVIEMVTGRPPWTGDVKFDSELQVMYYIANSGGHPKLPANLTQPATQFLQHAFRQEASERWSADKLMQHEFITKDYDIENTSRSLKDSTVSGGGGGYCGAGASQSGRSFSGSGTFNRSGGVGGGGGGGGGSGRWGGIAEGGGRAMSPNGSLMDGHSFDSTFATITDDGIEPPKTLSLKGGSCAVSASPGTRPGAPASGGSSSSAPGALLEDTVPLPHALLAKSPLISSDPISAAGLSPDSLQSPPQRRAPASVPGIASLVGDSTVESPAPLTEMNSSFGFDSYATPTRVQREAQPHHNPVGAAPASEQIPAEPERVSEDGEAAKAQSGKGSAQTAGGRDKGVPLQKKGGRGVDNVEADAEGECDGGASSDSSSLDLDAVSDMQRLHAQIRAAIADGQEFESGGGGGGAGGGDPFNGSTGSSSLGLTQHPVEDSRSPAPTSPDMGVAGGSDAGGVAKSPGSPPSLGGGGRGGLNDTGASRTTVSTAPINISTMQVEVETDGGFGDSPLILSSPATLADSYAKLPEGHISVSSVVSSETAHNHSSSGKSNAVESPSEIVVPQATAATAPATATAAAAGKKEAGKGGHHHHQQQQQQQSQRPSRKAVSGEGSRRQRDSSGTRGEGGGGGGGGGSRRARGAVPLLPNAPPPRGGGGGSKQQGGVGASDKQATGGSMASRPSRGRLLQKEEIMIDPNVFTSSSDGFM